MRASDQCRFNRLRSLSFRLTGWVVVLVVTHPWVGRTDQVNLGVLTQWVSPQVLAPVLRLSADRLRREGPLPMQFAAYFELACALFARDSYEDVADNLVSAIPGLGEYAPVKSSLLGARRRLGEAAVKALFEQVAVPATGPGTIGAFWRGLRTFAIDGFALEVPETAANRAFFSDPSGSNGVNPVRETGYPQARVVTLVETGTRAPVRAAIGTYLTGEAVLAGQLADAVGEGDLVIFDRRFVSISLYKAFTGRGAEVLVRAKRQVARRNVVYLPDGTYLVEIWNNSGRGKGRGEHITVRVIEYQIDGGETIRLLTSLTDPQQHPAAAIAALYLERWQAETSNLQIKTLQRGPNAVLRSGDPALIRQEIWAHLTVNYCLTRLIATIAHERGHDPERVSFTKVLKEVRRTVIQQATRTLAMAARHALDIADDLRRYVNPAREPTTSPRTLKHLRHRFPLRPATARGKPVTTQAPHPHHNPDKLIKTTLGRRTVKPLGCARLLEFLAADVARLRQVVAEAGQLSASVPTCPGGHWPTCCGTWPVGISTSWCHGCARLSRRRSGTWPGWSRSRPWIWGTRRCSVRSPQAPIVRMPMRTRRRSGSGV